MGCNFVKPRSLIFDFLNSIQANNTILTDVFPKLERAHRLINATDENFDYVRILDSFRLPLDILMTFDNKDLIQPSNLELRVAKRNFIIDVNCYLFLHIKRRKGDLELFGKIIDAFKIILSRLEATVAS